jgi:tetratricopeptide (TPR) repeat protein
MGFSEQNLASKMEQEIHKLLQQTEVSLVADDLLKRWLRDELSPEDQIIVGNLLINAGFLPTLKDHFVRLLTQDKFVSWVPLFELFNRMNVKLSAEMLEQIVVGMTEQNNLEELVHNKNFAHAYERFKPVYQKLLDEKIKKFNARKKTLIEKLQRAVNDSVDEEVQKISTELQQTFPEDQEIQSLKDDLDIARIRKLLKKKERELTEKIDWSMPDDLAEETQKLFESVEQAAKQNPAQAYDCAILLAQVDAFEEALKCLELAPDSLPKDWLKMDLLIKSKNYLAALNESLEIEKKYLKDPNTIFATLLLRSQALYGLGEKDQAIQILEKIIEVQPKNQNARILLHRWRSSS